MTQDTNVLATITPPRPIFPWHGTFWAVLTVCIVAQAFDVVDTGWLSITTIPLLILVGGSVFRRHDYALSRRRQPKALVAALLASVVVAAAALVVDDTAWWSPLAASLPALPSAGFTYLHFRTPPPPKAAPQA